jgi:hypothetical protein
LNLFEIVLDEHFKKAIGGRQLLVVWPQNNLEAIDNVYIATKFLLKALF